MTTPGQANLAGRIRATRHPKKDVTRHVIALSVMIFAAIGFANTVVAIGRLIQGQ